MDSRGKIVRLSKISLGFTFVIGLIWLASGIWLALQFAGPSMELDQRLANGTVFEDAGVALNASARLIFAVAYIISLAIGGLVLFALWRFFGELMKGTIVSESAGTWARRAGIGLLVSAVFGILFTAMQVFILSLFDEPDYMTLTIALQKEEAVALIASAVLVTIGHVLQLTTQIDQENRAFI